MADYRNKLAGTPVDNQELMRALMDRSPQNPGELSDPEQAKYLRGLVDQDPTMFGNTNALGMGAGIGLAAAPWMKFLPMPWPLKLLGTAAGAGISYMGGKGLWGDMDTMDKAIQAKRELPAFEKQDKR